MKKLKPSPVLNSSSREVMAEHEHSSVTPSLCHPRFWGFWGKMYVTQTKPCSGFTEPAQAGETLSTEGSIISCQILLSLCTRDKKYSYYSSHHYLCIWVIIALTDQGSQLRTPQRDKDKRMALSLQHACTKPLFSFLQSDCQVQLWVYVRSLSMICCFFQNLKDLLQ